MSPEILKVLIMVYFLIGILAGLAAIERFFAHVLFWPLIILRHALIGLYEILEGK